MTWFAVPVTDGSVHILPDWDGGIGSSGHWLDEYCPCLPESRHEWDGPFGMSSGALCITHNAWDGREADEGPGSDKSSDTIYAWHALDRRTDRDPGAMVGGQNASSPS